MLAQPALALHSIEQFTLGVFVLFSLSSRVIFSSFRFLRISHRACVHISKGGWGERRNTSSAIQQTSIIIIFLNWLVEARAANISRNFFSFLFRVIARVDLKIACQWI
jgi:hypothetical protein